MEQYLDIKTPEEFWSYYSEYRAESDKDCFDSLVNKLDVKYFVPCTHNVNNLPEDLAAMFDHPCRVLTKNNKYYTILQPYNHVDPRQLMDKYYLRNHIAWMHGFHHPKTYLIILSDDIMEFLMDAMDLWNTDKLKYLKQLYAYNDCVLPDELRDMVWDEVY